MGPEHLPQPCNNWFPVHFCRWNYLNLTARPWLDSPHPHMDVTHRLETSPQVAHKGSSAVQKNPVDWKRPTSPTPHGVWCHLPFTTQLFLRSILFSTNNWYNWKSLCTFFPYFGRWCHRKWRLLPGYLQPVRATIEPLHNSQWVRGLRDFVGQSHHQGSVNIHWLRPSCTDSSIYGRLPHLTVKVVEEKNLSGIPGTFYQGKVRPTQEAGDLLTRG